MTLAIPREVELEIRRHPEIKWTQYAREALIERAQKIRKMEILEKYLDKKPFDGDDLAWMDAHDWHPVDERPFRKELADSVNKTRRGKFRKIGSPSQLG